MKKMIHTLCRSTRQLLFLALLTGTTVSGAGPQIEDEPEQGVSRHTGDHPGNRE